MWEEWLIQFTFFRFFMTLQFDVVGSQHGTQLHPNRINQNNQEKIH